MSARSKPDRFNVLDEPYFFAGGTALIGTGRRRVHGPLQVRHRAIDGRAALFLQALRMAHLPELIVMQRAGGAGLLGARQPHPRRPPLVQAYAAHAVLVLRAPFRQAGSFRPVFPILARHTYFFALTPISFSFSSPPSLLSSVSFSGHPLYASTVWLTGFLLFARVGSAASSWFDKHINTWQRANPESGPAAFRDPTFRRRHRRSLAALPLDPARPVQFAAIHTISPRSSASLGLITPLAFFMGMPFPLGLSRMRLGARTLVPVGPGA